MADSMNEILHPGADKAGEPGFPHAPAGWKMDDALSVAQAEGLDAHRMAVAWRLEHVSRERGE